MPTRDSQGNKFGTLYQEHLQLGASFGEGLNGTKVPDSYGHPEEEARAFASGAALADVSGLYTLRFHGEPAPLFAQTAFAGRLLGVGEASFEAVLAGDGSLSSVPLLARTGEQEYAVWDFSPRSAGLDAWLGFLAHINQGGVAPFSGLSCEEESSKLVALVLWGRDAQRVLLDYVGKGEGLPVSGTVGTRSLDGHIETLLTCMTLGGKPCYLLMVPPNMARVLWRSLLSFDTVSPVGLTALTTQLRDVVPWFAELLNGGRLSLPARTLDEQGLIRGSRDFVGARGLA